MTAKKDALKLYKKPELSRYENIWEITRECPEWQCSVIVPPAP